MIADELLPLAADQPEAMALLNLALADADEVWLTRELRRQIAARRLGGLVDIDSPLGAARYTQLRNDVEKWVQARAGLRDDLTDREAAGEILRSLWAVLDGRWYCRACLNQAEHIGDMHAFADCPTHGVRAA